MSASFIVPPALRRKKPMRRPSCSTVLFSARACCSSKRASAGGRSWWRNRPASWWTTKNETRPARTPAARSSPGCLRGALQFLGAFAVIAAALLDPLHATIGIGGLVGVVLVDAGVHACLAFALLGIFRIDRAREHRGTGRRCGRRCRFLLGLLGRVLARFLGRRRSGRGRGRSRSRRRIGTALSFAEIVPLLAAERAGGLGGLVLGAAFLRGQRLRRRSGGKGETAKRGGAK